MQDWSNFQKEQVSWSKFQWECVGLVKLSIGVGRIVETLKWVGLIKRSLGTGGIGQTVCSNGQDQSNHLLESITFLSFQHITLLI